MEERAGATTGSDRLDVVIVGAGWAGMYMLHRVRRLGLTVRLLEAGTGVGGTWHWNCYPGAWSDSPSLANSYSFDESLQQEWEWSERYAAQPEIERYANHVADRFGLRSDIQFVTRVISADYDDDRRRWLIRTEAGDVIETRFCIMATGGLSVPHVPSIPGIDRFAGEVYHTAKWPREEVEWSGKRVGVVGTGASGMQLITALGKMPLEHLDVFQRTAHFSVPAQNRPLDEAVLREFKKTYAEYREQGRHTGSGVVLPVGDRPTLDYSDEEFEAKMAENWRLGGGAVLSSFPDFLVNEAANERIAEYLRRRIRLRVSDPAVAELLSPSGYPVGSRRILIEDDYFETYNMPHVTLVDLQRTPIVRITPEGIVTTSGSYALDVIAFATGFDSGTGAMLRIDVSGVGGATVADRWKNGPRTYLGLMMEGFPNLFMIAGPGSPSIRSHVMTSIEQHVDWIHDLLRHMTEDGLESVVPTSSAEDDWTAHVAEMATRTLLSAGDTPYVGANIPGKPRVYLAYVGGVGRYRAICDRVTADDYEGFVFTSHDGVVSGSPRWSGVGKLAPSHVPTALSYIP